MSAVKLSDRVLESQDPIQMPQTMPFPTRQQAKNRFLQLRDKGVQGTPPHSAVSGMLVVLNEKPLNQQMLGEALL